jgi:prepilin-type N-terminal cleavage/methylation domain-containing protein
VRRAARRDDGGFTLVEVLTVVIVLGLLAAIAIPVYMNQVNKARKASAVTQMRNMLTDIHMARDSAQSSLRYMTGSGCSYCNCRDAGYVPRVTDPGFAATACGVSWNNLVTALSTALGSPPAQVRKTLTDPWGGPILVDENEAEPGYPDLCTRVDFLISSGTSTTVYEGPGSIKILIPPSGYCP